MIKQIIKSIILSIIFIITINAQNIWYIDRDASGSNNGTSWSNAWHGINNINWASVSSGDTIYFSGGTDSTLYVSSRSDGSHLIFPSSYGLDGRVYSQEVVLCPSWETGHNGGVYIGARNNNTQWILEIHAISNIKLTGFNFIDNRTANNFGTMLYLGGDGVNGNHYRDSLITIENCKIIGYAHQVYMSGYKITIKDCYIEGLDCDTDIEPDPFGISSGRGSHVIDGNIIIMRNDNTTNANHYDGIQISNIGWSGMTDYTRQSITICNNLIINAPSTSGAWNNMIYSYGWDYTPSITFYVYNNIIVNRITNSACGGVTIGRLDSNHRNSLYFLNNTLILQNNGTGNPIVNWSLDTLVVKNNLIVVDNNIPAFLNLDIGYNVYDIDYNHYAEYGGLSGNIAVLSSSYNWSAWQNAGHDLNSANGNSTAVTFVNKYGLNKSDYYTITGRDAGVDLSNQFPFLQYDILGNPRSGTWDIGALEYQDGQSNNIILKSKLFLQGPFNTNLMNTNLSQNSLLPNSQPFNTSPWNYNGSESLGSGSTSTYVDWVLVELRNSSNPTQVVARKAAILKNDGSLLNTDGNVGVPFNNLQAGSYYIAVFHRNHLAVMSAAPVQLSANTPTYDFTTGMNKANGQNPMKELAPGKYGMFAGDGNSNGGITIADRNEVWAPQNGSMGYLKGDFNLDGGVTAADVNLYWNINNGSMTQVP